MNIVIRKIQTERALSPTGIEIADYTLNPYRGCSFGCDYCYVRMNKFVRKTDYHTEVLLILRRI